MSDKQAYVAYSKLWFYTLIPRMATVGRVACTVVRLVTHQANVKLASSN